MALAREQALDGGVAREQRVLLAQLHGQDGGSPQGERLRARWDLTVSVDDLRLFFVVWVFFGGAARRVRGGAGQDGRRGVLASRGRRQQAQVRYSCSRAAAWATCHVLGAAQRKKPTFRKSARRLRPDG